MYAADTTACFPITKERDNGDCELKRYKTFSDSNTTASFALEIVNDIVEKAMNIAENTLDLIPEKIEKISPAVVGDILDNILSNNTPDPSEHIFAEDETMLLDEEIKKMINEMKCPEQKPIMATGVGDQLTSKSEITLPDKILEQPKRNTLERKGRLTNLVRNSKNLFTKLVSDNDSKRASSSNLEEYTEERVIKVIDFEYGIMGDNVPFNMQADHHFIDPTVYPYPQDTMMEVIDLEAERNIEPTHSENLRRFVNTLGRKERKHGRKDETGNRRKWNFGARILRYFRRHSKREEQRETKEEN